MLAQVLALDGAIGSQFSEVEDGVYTGRPTGLFIYRSDKARAIEQLAEREGIDLAVSYAYSDSESDLPMLRVVGHPVAVNPDQELARVARDEGWEILRFDRLGPAAEGHRGADGRGRRRRDRQRGARGSRGSPDAAVEGTAPRSASAAVPG